MKRYVILILILHLIEPSIDEEEEEWYGYENLSAEEEKRLVIDCVKDLEVNPDLMIISSGK